MEGKSQIKKRSAQDVAHSIWKSTHLKVVHNTPITWKNQQSNGIINSLLILELETTMLKEIILSVREWENAVFL